MSSDRESKIKEGIIADVLEERIRQDKKFGKMPRNLSLYLWVAVLTEETGEVARAVIEEDFKNYETELIQVAAVAFAALEDLRLGRQSLDDQGL